MLRQAEWDSLLTPIIYHHFDLGRTMVPALRSRLFNVQTSTLASEKGTGMGGISPDVWNQYEASGAKGSADFDQLYTQTYTHVEYPVEVKIERRLLDDDQYNRIGDYIARVGMSAEQKREIDAASIFNNAFSGTTWADGVVLCSTSHPKSPNKSSGTYSNKGTTALTADAVSTTRKDMMKFKDDKGNLIGVMPNILLVPPDLEDTAIKAVGSMLNPDTANNAINPQAGRFDVIPWLRLTDTNAWFMIDEMWMKQVLRWYDRTSLEVKFIKETTTEIVYEVYMRYSYGVDDWRWIYGHNPS